MGRQRAMRRWMIVVGIVYLVMGLRLLPQINGPMIEAADMHESVFTGEGLQPDSDVWYFVLDWMGTFGLTFLPLGALLLVAAKQPSRNRLLVHLVIWRELVVGIVDDAWFLSRDYTGGAFYLGFIVFHLVVIGTGILVLRRTPADPPIGTHAAAPPRLAAHVPG